MECFYAANITCMCTLLSQCLNGRMNIKTYFNLLLLILSMGYHDHCIHHWFTLVPWSRVLYNRTSLKDTQHSKYRTQCMCDRACENRAYLHATKIHFLFERVMHYPTIDGQICFSDSFLQMLLNHKDAFLGPKGH